MRNNKRLSTCQKQRAREFLAYFIELDEGPHLIPSKPKVEGEGRPTFIAFEDDPRRLSDSMRMGVATSQVQHRVRPDQTEMSCMKRPATPETVTTVTDKDLSMYLRKLPFNEKSFSTLDSRYLLNTSTIHQ